MVIAAPVAGALITGGTQLLSNIFGTKAQADISREEFELRQQELAEERKLRLRELGLSERQIEEQERVNKARESAYGGFLGRGEQIAGAGEEAFLGEAGTALPELAEMKEDILTGEAEALQKGGSQMQAELAKAGVRGGQAATQLRRGIGEMATGAQRDITGLKYEEASRRAASRRAYQQAKGLAGTRAQLAAPAF